jgi:hypothetical protein
MKTIREWFNELPQPKRARAFRAALSDPGLQGASLDFVVESLEEAISRSFEWGNTEEGYDYWAGLGDVQEGYDDMSPGSPVTYHKPPGQPEHGMIKSVDPFEPFAFVVYRCNDDWERFEEFTAGRTPLQFLKPGWI